MRWYTNQPSLSLQIPWTDVLSSISLSNHNHRILLQCPLPNNLRTWLRWIRWLTDWKCSLLAVTALHLSYFFSVYIAQWYKDEQNPVQDPNDRYILFDCFKIRPTKTWNGHLSVSVPTWRQETGTALHSVQWTQICKERIANTREMAV